MKLKIFFAVILICLFALGVLMKTERPVALNSAERYMLSKEEIPTLEDAAIRGDCHSAERLGQYHANVTLEHVNAVRWYRIAAKCPQSAPKEILVGLLVGMSDDPAVHDEILRLIAEIRTINPDRAESARIHFEKQRPKAN